MGQEGLAQGNVSGVNGGRQALPVAGGTAVEHLYAVHHPFVGDGAHVDGGAGGLPYHAFLLHIVVDVHVLGPEDHKGGGVQGQGVGVALAGLDHHFQVMVFPDQVARGRVIGLVGEVGGVVAHEVVRMVQVHGQGILRRVVDGAAQGNHRVLSGLQREVVAVSRHHDDGVVQGQEIRQGTVLVQPGIVGVAVIRGDAAHAQPVQIGDHRAVVVNNHVLVALVSAFRGRFGTAAAIDFLDDQGAGLGMQQGYFQFQILSTDHYVVPVAVEHVHPFPVTDRYPVNAVGQQHGGAGLLAHREFVAHPAKHVFNGDGRCADGLKAVRINGLYQQAAQAFLGIGLPEFHTASQQQECCRYSYNFILHVSP